MRFGRLMAVLAVVVISGLWSAAMARSTLLHRNAPDATGDDARQTYYAWIDDKISSLSGDNEGEQRKAAEQLGIAIPTAEARPRVLAALEPHLNGGDKDFRVKCVQAYGHWATADQTKQLLMVVATPPTARTMSGDENAWAAAAAALVPINPKAAQAAVDKRVSAFFFRTSIGPLLTQMALENSPAQPTALALLKKIDGFNTAGQMPLRDAERLVSSDSAAERLKGAKSLGVAVVTAAEQPRVLTLLKSHVMGKDGRARLPFVEAYAHWATTRDLETLKAIIAFPEQVEGLTGQENCWAAATVGLARLDPQAARQAMADRTESFFYRSALHNYLLPLAQGNGPTQPVASWLLGELDSGADHPPVPPGFSPDQPPQVPGVVPHPNAPRARADEDSRAHRFV